MSSTEVEEVNNNDQRRKKLSTSAFLSTICSCLILGSMLGCFYLTPDLTREEKFLVPLLLLKFEWYLVTAGLILGFASLDTIYSGHIKLRGLAYSIFGILLPLGMLLWAYCYSVIN